MSAPPHPCLDWQSCDAGDVTTLVQAEARAWFDQLHWDVTDAWHVIEPARRSGSLPGLVTTDEAGRPVGWTAFLPLGGHLQVMAIAAPDVRMAGALVDGILDSPVARSCASTIVCVRAGTPELPEVLRSRRFNVETYRYMQLMLPLAGAPDPDLQPWHAHEAAMARLCARAYRNASGVRAFAPGGTLSEWEQYVGSLTAGTGCGRFLPGLSRVMLDPGASDLYAAIVLTDLGAGSLHVAQMAVDPSRQGQGIGRRLLAGALAAADGHFARVTLLVAESNARAAHLYQSIGFRDHAAFIVAARPSIN
jgi:ribosomal protein S18 acetylase RimI-like enzyme